MLSTFQSHHLLSFGRPSLLLASIATTVLLWNPAATAASNPRWSHRGAVAAGSASSGTACGTITVSVANRKPRVFRVTKYRMGNPDDGLTCARARRIIRNFTERGTQPSGWLCNERGSAISCSAGNRVGWLIKAQPRSVVPAGYKRCHDVIIRTEDGEVYTRTTRLRQRRTTCATARRVARIYLHNAEGNAGTPPPPLGYGCTTTDDGVSCAKGHRRVIWNWAS